MSSSVLEARYPVSLIPPPLDLGGDVLKVGETYSKLTGETCKPVTFHVD